MNPNRFDVLSRALAGNGRLSRRRVLGRAGAGGVGAGVLAALGFGRTATMAAPARQDEDEEGPDDDVCVLDFVANVRLGPSSERRATRTLAGELRLPIDRDGGIVGGTLVQEDGEELDVQGQATGRSVSLRIALGDGRALVAVGAGFSPFAECNVAYSGPASGPEPGDLGDWRTEPNPGPVSTDGCPEVEIACDAGCDEVAGERQTIDCACVTVGNAVCDVECEPAQTLTDDCECVCLLD